MNGVNRTSKIKVKYGRRPTIKLDAISVKPQTPMTNPPHMRQPRKLSVTLTTVSEPSPFIRKQSIQPPLAFFNHALEIRNITDKISRAVNEMDTLYAAEEDDELLNDIIEHTYSLNSGQLKSQLKLFISKYKNVNEDIVNKGNERNEILSSLSDWFSCTQLSPIQLSTIEERHMRQVRDNIAKTSLKFEKLRSLNEEIEKSKQKGQRTDYLDRKSKMLTDEALQDFKDCQKVVKDKTSQSSKKESNEMANMWSSASVEITEMLNKVRTEGVSAIAGLQAKIEEVSKLVNRYQEESIMLKEQIAQMQRAAHKWKEDNAILTEENAFLEERIEKFRNELSKTRKLLRKHEALPPAQEWEMETHADVNPENAEKVADVVKETRKQNPGMPRIKKLQSEMADLKEKINYLEEILTIREKDLTDKEKSIKVKDERVESLRQELSKTSKRLQAKTEEVKSLKGFLKTLGQKLNGIDYEIWKLIEEKSRMDEDENMENNEEIVIPVSYMEKTFRKSSIIQCTHTDSTLHLDCNVKIFELEEQLEFQARKLKDAEKAIQTMRAEIKKLHASQSKQITSGTAAMRDNKRCLPKIHEEKMYAPEEEDVGDIKKRIQEQISQEDADITNFTNWAKTVVEQRQHSIDSANKQLQENMSNIMGDQAGHANITHNLSKEQDAFQERMRENINNMERGLNMITTAHTTSMDAVNNQLDIFEEILSSLPNDGDSLSDHNSNNVRNLTDDVGVYLGVRGTLPNIATAQSKPEMNYDKKKQFHDKPAYYRCPPTTPNLPQPQSFLNKTGPIMLVNPKIAQSLLDGQQSYRDQLHDFWRKKRKDKPKVLSFGQEQRKLQEILDQETGRNRSSKSQTWSPRPLSRHQVPLLGEFNRQDLIDESEDNEFSILDLEMDLEEMLKAKRKADQMDSQKDLEVKHSEDQYDLHEGEDLAQLILTEIWDPSLTIDPEIENKEYNKGKTASTGQTMHIIPEHNFLPNLENIKKKNT